MRSKSHLATTQNKNFLSAVTAIIITTAIFLTQPAAANDMTPEDEAILNEFLEDVYATDSVAKNKATEIKQWVQHIYGELPILGTNLLTVQPVDYKTFCPKYNALNESRKKQFWALFTLAIARYESALDPKTAYKESFTDNTGKRVISRGLLQISFESSKGYYCGFTTAQEIHHPTKNLSCGIRILNKWMKTDSRIASKVGSKWKGGARYWAVLRAGKSNSYKNIVKATNAIPFCK